MINPYRHTPSARPTKISDLPKALGSSLIAPKAALAALATAIPPPTQEVLLIMLLPDIQVL